MLHRPLVCPFGPSGSIHFRNINILYDNGLKIHFVSTNYAEDMMHKASDSNGAIFYCTKIWIGPGRGKVSSDIPELHEELNLEVYGENSWRKSIFTAN